MESLGELIKRTLREKGIKEAYVAKKMNVSKQVINQIDRRKNFDFNILSELSKASGIDFTKYATTIYSARINPVSTDATLDAKTEETNMPKLTYEFSIPEAAYGNIKAFQDDILKIAEKHGMIIK